MESLCQDLRYGLRGLAKNPGFTLVAVLTLALGIGANSAIFSVVNAVLLRPLPYREPERIVTALRGGWFPIAPANFLDWRAQQSAFEQIGAAQAWGPTLTGRERPEQVGALQVTSDLFSVLGVSPALGRTFLPGEDQPGAGKVVVLSHHLWQRRFGGDPALVGQTITLNGDGYTVVGVMPAGFQFAPFWVTNAELFAPLNLGPRAGDRAGQSLRVFARLKEGVTREQAQAEMNAISRRLEQQYPETNKNSDIRIDPLHEKVAGKVRPALLVLLGAVSFVLLIACANVANLLLARSAARRKEIAVRAALGAGRVRLIRQLLTESMLLGLAGGGLGLLLAGWGINLLVALSPANLPRVETISLDLRVAGFTLAVALATGLIFGLAPALQASKLDLNEALKEGGRGSTEGLRRNRVRGALVVAEVALALVLLIGAGLMIRSFRRLQAVDAGFDPRRVLTLTVQTSGPKYATGAQRAAFFDQLLPRLAALPGVASASAINHLPLAGDTWTLGFAVEGRPAPAPGERQGAVYRIVRPGYFRTMGMTVLNGRDFTDQDRAGAPGVAMINETFARSVWPNEDPIGKRIRVNDDGPNPREVIGVVKDAKQSEWTADARREVYLSHLQTPTPSYLTLVLRAAGEPLGLAAAVQREVWSIDQDLPVAKVASLEQVVADAVGQPRFNLLLLNLFAAVALALAAVGIYGVMAYSVAQRTHEIGIRLALGARAGDVLKLVVGQGLILTLIGLAIGLGAAFGLTRLMESLLYGVSATDPATFIAIPLLLAGVALFASYLPARRAMKVDPMTALRDQ